MKSLAAPTLPDAFYAVTGAAGRLGAAWTDAIVRAGGRVAAIDKAETRERLGAMASANPGLVRAIECDVTDPQSARKCADALRDLGSPIAGLVNNAGIDQPPAAGSVAALEDFPAEATRHVLDVNVVGAWIMAQQILPLLRPSQGAVVNIGSMYATRSADPAMYEHIPGGFVKPPAYGASKAALRNLTRQMAVHWGPAGVRVNMLSPGAVQGDQDDVFRNKMATRLPLRRMANLADLHGPLVFLLSDASRYITGIDLAVDGGYLAL